MIIYYDSKTGNVERFINKLQALKPNWIYININTQKYFSLKGHFITYTTGFGEIPTSSEYFVNKFGQLIQSVASSGNRNWGNNFGLAADLIANMIGCKLIHKFELSGLKNDVNFIANAIESLDIKLKNKTKLKFNI